MTGKSDESCYERRGYDGTMAARRVSRQEILRAALLAGARIGVSCWKHVRPRAEQARRVGRTGRCCNRPGSAGAWQQMRAQGQLIPLETQKLRDNIYCLHGPGGTMVVLNGPDGKILVDSSYLAVAPKLKASLDAIGNAPLKILVNTHWHSGPARTVCRRSIRGAR